MRRHALHVAAALLGFSLGFIAADGHGRLAYALPLSLLCFLLAKALPRVEIDFHFVMVAAGSLLLWTAGAFALAAFFREPTFDSCVLTFPDAPDAVTFVPAGDAPPPAAYEPPTGITAYECGVVGASFQQGDAVWAGLVDKKAVVKPPPVYPPLAKAACLKTTVAVSVLIDESGRVVTAQAVSGHPLLRQSAVEAACRARFHPTLVNGPPVRVSGILTYNFTL